MTESLFKLGGMVIIMILCVGIGFVLVQRFKQHLYHFSRKRPAPYNYKRKKKRKY